MRLDPDDVGLKNVICQEMDEFELQPAEKVIRAINKYLKQQEDLKWQLQLTWMEH